jgi:hypothetical protein
MVILYGKQREVVTRCTCDQTSFTVFSSAVLLGSSAPALEADIEGNTENRERNGFTCLWVCYGVYHTGGAVLGSPDQSPSPY